MESELAVNILLGIEKDYETMFEGLSSYDKKHCIRVANYVHFLYEKACDRNEFKNDATIDKKYLPYIKKIVRFFDLGKVMLPDGLNKRIGKFSLKEYKVFCKHPDKSSIIYRSIIRNKKITEKEREYVDMAYEIALHHHENYDGSGFPFHLTGDSVSSLTRLVRIMVKYDSMTSMRYYLPTYSHQYALSVINRAADTKFDPKFVKLLNEYSKDIEKMNNNENETKSNYLMIDVAIHLIGRKVYDNEEPYWWFNKKRYYFSSIHEFDIVSSKNDFVPFINYDYLQLVQSFLDRYSNDPSNGIYYEICEENVHEFCERMKKKNLFETWKQYEYNYLISLVVEWCKKNSIHYSMLQEFENSIH